MATNSALRGPCGLRRELRRTPPLAGCGGTDVAVTDGDPLRSGLAAFPCRLQGVQADSASFAKLGLPRDAPSSARHEGVPVLMTDLEPGTLLFTFAQRWP